VAPPRESLQIVYARPLTKACRELIDNTPPNVFMHFLDYPRNRPLCLDRKAATWSNAFSGGLYDSTNIFRLYDFGNETGGMLKRTHDSK
jgi:hypothetical protein